ncbi:G2E3 ligase, partial [Polypterus senegalus]|nr:G2E3 ligase [Polypterus senegalus]
MESGIDTGGPKREFLELLMQHFKNRTLFEGRENEKYLTCDNAGKTSFAKPSLEDILVFSTGVSSIPPIGFHPKPTINFLHNESPYPIAQTCTNSLSIPIHKTYDKFKYHMNFGILNSTGFGQH